MSEVVAKFEKVSFEQWYSSLDDGLFDQQTAKELYDEIKLPKRATVGSAGYDFFLPYDIIVYKNDFKMFPTGIRCNIKDGWVLTCYPRSGYGFKYGISLANTVGVIDSDYYNADNEGHIFVKLVSQSVLATNFLYLKKGTAFMQGIFLPYGVTEDDNVTEQRTGGFGSTDKK